MEDPPSPHQPQATDKSAPMAKPEPKRKPSMGVNGYRPEPKHSTPTPSDYEIIRKESWIAELIQRAWPMLVVIAGGIFAAGGLWVKIDTTKEWHIEERAAILAQGKAIDDIKSSFADFRVEWAREEAKMRKSIEDLAPVADDRPKILPVPKKRVYHRPSGLFH